MRTGPRRDGRRPSEAELAALPIGYLHVLRALFVMATLGTFESDMFGVSHSRPLCVASLTGVYRKRFGRYLSPDAASIRRLCRVSAYHPGSMREEPFGGAGDAAARGAAGAAAPCFTSPQVLGALCIFCVISV